MHNQEVRFGQPRLPNSFRTAPCPWCRKPLPPACCPVCLNRAAKGIRRIDAQAAADSSQRALEIALSEHSHALALHERRHAMLERNTQLRALAERRAVVVRSRRRQLQERDEELRERRRRHEIQAAEWAVARRRLDAKHFKVSREDFFRDPCQHRETLGAFHIYQELSVASHKLQLERRRRCAEIVTAFPLKWIGSTGGDYTVTLGQVQSFTPSGVLHFEEFKDLHAAVSHLVVLLPALAAYLDVTLPFGCAPGHQGNTAPPPPSGMGDSEEPFAVASSHATSRAHPYSQRSAAQAAYGPWPCVYHPFRRRWHYFSVYDNICTSEFGTARKLVDEDLRQLCASQGEYVRDHVGTLQLLAHVISATNLGCLSPPASNAPAPSTASRSVPDTPRDGPAATAWSVTASCSRDAHASATAAGSRDTARSPRTSQGRSRTDAESTGIVATASAIVTASACAAAAVASVVASGVSNSTSPVGGGATCHGGAGESAISMSEDGEWTFVEHQS